MHGTIANPLYWYGVAAGAVGISLFWAVFVLPGAVSRRMSRRRRRTAAETIHLLRPLRTTRERSLTEIRRTPPAATHKATPSVPMVDPTTPVRSHRAPRISRAAGARWVAVGSWWYIRCAVTAATITALDRCGDRVVTWSATHMYSGRPKRHYAT